MADQIITTRFRSEGAGRVAKDTETIGRAQTRLGQASASAGRQFSAQANGLGGLVQAYAGAAANIFAITAAFTALNTAARFEQVIAGTNALASSIGANGRDIINTVQDITKSQLSLLETAQTVNIGLAAGFNTQQIEDLSDVSLRASKALGRSLTDAFTRVSRGAAKLEPELLDELGIFTRIDPAVQAYANSIGRSVSSLTNFERRQAFANAVIAEGTRKFRDVNTSTKTTAESLEALSSTIINLGLQFGSVLATAIAPFADFITENVSNSLALFGLLAKQIGGLAVTVLSAGIQKATTSLQLLGDSAVINLNKLSSSYSKATAAAALYAKEQVTLTRFGTMAERQIKTTAQAVLQEAAANKLNTAEKVKNAIATLRAARAVEIEFARRSTNATNIQVAVNAARSLTRQIILLDAAQRKSAVGTVLLSGAIKGLSISIGFLGAVLGRLIGFLFTIITVASLAQLALDGLGKVFGFQVNILESVTSFFSKLVKGIFELSNAVKGLSGTFNEELSNAAKAAGAFGEEVDTAVKAATSAFADIEIRSLGADESGIETFTTEVEELNDAFKEAAKAGPAAVAALEVLVEKFQNLGDGSVIAGQKVALAISRIADESGVANKDVAAIIQNLDAFSNINFTRRQGMLFIDGEQVTTLVDGTLKFRNGMLEVSSILVQASDKINDFNMGLADGSLNAERAAQAVGAINNTVVQGNRQLVDFTEQLDGLNIKINRAIREGRLEEIGKLTALRDELLVSKEILADNIEKVRVEENLAQVQASRLADLEKEEKLRKKIFGNAGEKLEELGLRGTIGAGGVAQTSQQGQLNQLLAIQKRLQDSRRTQDNALIGTNDRALLEEVDKITEQITTKFKKLEEFRKSGNIDSAEAKTISEEINRLEDARVNVTENLSDTASEVLQARKDEKALIDILALKEVEMLGTLQKQFQQVEQINNARNQQLGQLELSLEQQRLQIQQKISTEIRQQAKNTLEANKAYGELFGIFTDSAKLGFLRDKFQIELAQAEEDKQAAIKSAQLTFASAELQRENAKLSMDIENERMKGDVNFLKGQREIFSDFTADIDEVLKQRVKEMAEANGVDLTVKSFAQGSVGRTSATSGDQAITAIDLIVQANIEASKKINDATMTKNEEALQGVIDFEDAKLNTLESYQAQQLKLAEIEASTRFKIFKGVTDGINSNLEPALNSLFDSIADGSLTTKNFAEGFKDALFNTFESIRKNVLQSTLIEPAKEFITKKAMDIFGFERAQGIDAAKVDADGSLFVTMKEGVGGMNNLKKSIEEADQKGGSFIDTILDKFSEFKSKGLEIFDSFKGKLGDVFSNIGDAAKGIFSSLGGAGKGILSSIGSGLSGITSSFGSSGASGGGGGGFLSSIFSSFGASASGGFIPSSATQRLAAGGQARDRVPALLEPGEFVMKRSSANSIGAPALNQMNATGKAGGNVVVNIQNQGTPQDATASEPRFDGEKFVIDIVTRDLRNNGPIRKSLRGGGAG